MVELPVELIEKIILLSIYQPKLSTFDFRIQKLYLDRVRSLCSISIAFDAILKSSLLKEISINSLQELNLFHRWAKLHRGNSEVTGDDGLVGLVKKLRIGLDVSILKTEYWNGEGEFDSDGGSPYRHPLNTPITKPKVVLNDLIEMLNLFQNLEILSIETGDNQLQLDEDLLIDVDSDGLEYSLLPVLELPRLKSLQITSSFLHLRAFTTVNLSLDELLVHGSFIQGGGGLVQNPRLFFEKIGKQLKSLSLLDVDSSAINNILPHLSNLTHLRLNRISSNAYQVNRGLFERFPQSLISLHLSLGGEAIASVLRGNKAAPSVPLLKHIFIDKLKELVILYFLPEIETLSIRYSSCLPAALDRLVTVGRAPFKRLIVGKDLQRGVKDRCEKLGVKLEVMT